MARLSSAAPSALARRRAVADFAQAFFDLEAAAFELAAQAQDIA